MQFDAAHPVPVPQLSRLCETLRILRNNRSYLANVSVHLDEAISILECDAWLQNMETRLVQDIDAEHEAAKVHGDSVVGETSA